MTQIKNKMIVMAAVDVAILLLHILRYRGLIPANLVYGILGFILDLGVLIVGFDIQKSKRFKESSLKWFVYGSMLLIFLP
ncbi:hypothetical protein ACAW68_04390 [Weissella confusa]|uniref:hypothetical protein n=1 Tax=Weissella confusa TaxID=1583 RepID=UPI0035A3C8B9